VLDADLESRLVRCFADAVMASADLPNARREDVEAAPKFATVEGKLTCVCGITGSTYEAEWDGQRTSAEAVAVDAGRSTARLIAGSRHYAWLRATR
jgi:hypothetical protein